MELSRHITGEDILPMRQIRYPQEHPIGKPNGFWVSDGSWEAWMKAEGFTPSGVSHGYSVKCDLSQALTISSLQSLQELNAKYGNRGDIDWRLVSMNHTAVVFLNYNEVKSQVCFSLDMMWFYGIDCNSCCIFDLSIIQSIEPIPDYQFEWD